MYYGGPVGTLSVPAPVFPLVGTDHYKNGIVKQYQELGDRIVAAPGYMVKIGEDLGIVGSESTPKLADNVAPKLKPGASTGYSGSIFSAACKVPTPSGSRTRRTAGSLRQSVS